MQSVPESNAPAPEPTDEEFLEMVAATRARIVELKADNARRLEGVARAAGAPVNLEGRLELVIDILFGPADDEMGPQRLALELAWEERVAGVLEQAESQFRKAALTAGVAGDQRVLRQINNNR